MPFCAVCIEFISTLLLFKLLMILTHVLLYFCPHCMILTEQDLFLSGEWLPPSGSTVFRYEVRYKSSLLMVVYEKQRTGLLSYAKCPLFTPYNARIFHQHPEMNDSVRFNTELGLYEKLLSEELPADLLQLKFYTGQVHLPMINSQRLFAKPAFYEYIDAKTNPHEIWSAMSSETRNDILYAREKAEIDNNPELRRLSSFLCSNSYYRRHGLREDQLVQTLTQNCMHGKVRMYTVSYDGKICSASVMIRSGSVWYYWLNHNDKDCNIRGAHLLLLWQCVQDALHDQCRFSFDGSSVPSITKVFKLMGSSTEVIPVTIACRKPWLKKLIQWQ